MDIRHCVHSHILCRCCCGKFLEKSCPSLNDKTIPFKIFVNFLFRLVSFSIRFCRRKLEDEEKKNKSHAPSHGIPSNHFKWLKSEQLNKFLGTRLYKRNVIYLPDEIEEKKTPNSILATECRMKSKKCVECTT